MAFNKRVMLKDIANSLKKNNDLNELVAKASEQKKAMPIPEKTRQSLIGKLQNWDNQAAWNDFYNTYSRLIYYACRKANLRDHEAQDCMQFVLLKMANQSKKESYDPEKGSFRSWLMRLTSWTISDMIRKRNQDESRILQPFADDAGEESIIDQQEDTKARSFEQIWNEEWQSHIILLALERVKSDIKSIYYQIYINSVFEGLSTSDLVSKWNKPAAYIYLAIYRCKKALIVEIAKIKKEENAQLSD